MNDINGIELVAGDNVVMAVNQYESAIMIKGVVEKIVPRKPRRREPRLCVYVREDDGSQKWTFTPQNQILKV